MDDGKAGCDEVTIREPQYVFAVNGCLIASRHSEQDDFTDLKQLATLRQLKEQSCLLTGDRLICVSFEA